MRAVVLKSFLEERGDNSSQVLSKAKMSCALIGVEYGDPK